MPESDPVPATPPDPRWRSVRLSVPLFWEFIPAFLRPVLLAAVALSPLYLDLAERRGVHVPAGCASPAPKPVPKPIVIPPDPGPKPGPPSPDPAPAPKPAGPLRVLIVYESSAPMTQDQINTFNSSTFRAFLDSHCARGPDGRAEWRVWDKDIDVSNENATWKSLWSAAKPLVGSLPLPQIVIFRGQSGTAYPLPATSDAATALVAKVIAGGTGVNK